MSTHSHVGSPCSICGFPLEGSEATEFLKFLSWWKLNSMSTVKGHMLPLDKEMENATYDLIEKVKELLMFTERDGTVVNGFRTQDIIKELRSLTNKYK